MSKRVQVNEVQIPFQKNNIFHQKKVQFHYLKSLQFIQLCFVNLINLFKKQYK